MMTWDDWYKTLQGQWMEKRDIKLKLFNVDCVEPLWFGWLFRSTWQMALTDY